jgi:hypothetical protein
MYRLGILICLLLSSCIGSKFPLLNQPPPISENPPVSEIDAAVFSELDIDKDGQLTKTELTKLPVQTKNDALWVFLSIVGSVIVVCIVAQYFSTKHEVVTNGIVKAKVKKQPNTTPVNAKKTLPKSSTSKKSV